MQQEIDETTGVSVPSMIRKLTSRRLTEQLGA